MTARWTGQEHLEQDDTELWNLLREEKLRQLSVLELKASENFCSRAACEAMSSCLNNKSFEGYPGARCFGGNDIIDAIETVCQRRALEVFNLDPTKWGVNVQAYSGSLANFAVFTGLLQPHERIMGLDFKDGGHLTHGYTSSDGQRVPVTSVFFETMPYNLDPVTGLIDYDHMAELARSFRPKLIIAGPSSYSRSLDYARFREIADEVGAFLMADMAHISGFIFTDLMQSPFPYADVVTTTTHKTLRGVRSGMIFYRRGCRINAITGQQVYYDLEVKLNHAVFPSLQGGPHNHTIAGVAVALHQAKQPFYKQYMIQVIANARAMAEKLMVLGYKLITDGTDNHMVLVDLRPLHIDGRRVELVCGAVSITTNELGCPGDAPDSLPGGIRLGSPALTSRNMNESNFETVIEFLHQAIVIAKEIQVRTEDSLKDFKLHLQNHKGCQKLHSEVVKFARSFPMPGFIKF